MNWRVAEPLVGGLGPQRDFGSWAPVEMEKYHAKAGRRALCDWKRRYFQNIL